MRPLSSRILGVGAVVCGAVLWGSGEAAAQSSASAVPSLAPSAAIQSMQSNAAGFGAPVGMPAPDPLATGTGSSLQGNIFNNPLAAPLLYNSMAGPAATSGSQSTGGLGLGAGASQLGVMMLLSNQQNGLFGTGRMGGTQGVSQTRSSAASPSASSTGSRASNRPGGRSSRYFNRSGGHSTYPRNYFNRRPSYFP